jgi:hypothetical protein
MNIDWNNINTEIQELNKFIQQNIKQSETNINKLLTYDCVTDKDKFMKVLEKDTIEINKLYLLLNLINFIFKDNKIKEAENMLEEYNSKLKINANFIKKLIYFNKINSNLDRYQKKFIENIINQLKYNKINNQDKIFIEGIVYKNYNINIYNIDNFLLSLDKKERTDVIKKYNNNIYDNLFNNLILKFNQSNHHLEENYFLYKNKISNNAFVHIKKFINELISTINKELLKKKESYKLKNYDYDDLVIYENNFNIYNLSLKYILDKFLKFFSVSFNLQFVLNSNKNVWNKNVILYEIKKNNILFGYLYLDLIKNETSNKPNIPLFVNFNNTHLNKLYSIEEKGGSVIFGSFKNYESKVITFNDSLKLFIELMLAIYNLFNINSFGFSNITTENKNIVETLAEKIFQNELFFNNIYEDDEIVRKKNEELKLIKLVKFRYLCIDSIFDMAIHIDKDIIKCNSKTIFENTYKEICKCFRIENFDYSNLNPNLLYNINGDLTCKYYCLVFNEIICHNIANLIVKKRLGQELFNTLTNLNNNFMDNLKEYLNKYNVQNKNIKFIFKSVSNNPDFTETITSQSEFNNYKEI